MSYGFVFRNGPDFYVAVQDEDLYFTEPSPLKELESTFNDISEQTAVLANVDVVEGDNDILYKFEVLEQLVMNCRVQDAVEKMGSNHLFTRCMMLALMKGQGTPEVSGDDNPEEDSLSA